MPESPEPRRVFWLMIAVGAAASSLLWLGVIEMANLQASQKLQALNQAPERDWYVPPLTRQDLVDQMAVDENGEPLEQPLPAEVVKELDDAWLPHSRKLHLFYMLVGFGGIMYPLAVAAQGAGVMALRTRPTRGQCVMAVVALAIGTLVIARGAYLGVLRHGAFQLLG